jgi:hypothetical protein
VLAGILSLLGGSVGVLVAVLVGFGFAPGAAARLIARMFPKEDPRRAEVVAEVYTIPRWDRPFWILEQLERSIFEAIPARLRSRERLNAFETLDGVRKPEGKHRKSRSAPSAPRHLTTKALPKHENGPPPEGDGPSSSSTR